MEDILISITALQGQFPSILLIILIVIGTKVVEAGAAEESQKGGGLIRRPVALRPSTVVGQLGPRGRLRPGRPPIVEVGLECRIGMSGILIHVYSIQ